MDFKYLYSINNTSRAAVHLLAFHGPCQLKSLDCISLLSHVQLQCVNVREELPCVQQVSSMCRRRQLPSAYELCT